MFDLLSATVTLRLFGPLLVGVFLAISLFVLGRLVATRKIAHALDTDDFDDPGIPRLVTPDADVPGSIEHVPTREFVRARDSKRQVA
ncbi:hypothetical protein ENSA5_25080 [Enhygromyxa salina]|uniref:Uncharacterized protein n=1 Tax=Enhygromyxa salina TaxID=215803 RepID=A0A2S9YB37_9BACT|nr:hypothetical protein [Enhygromyxa salina]PRQ02272.1 hypothetical protein ENSA5_25080 [Enhygromyxa salina]